MRTEYDADDDLLAMIRFERVSIITLRMGNQTEFDQAHWMLYYDFYYLFVIFVVHKCNRLFVTLCI